MAKESREERCKRADERMAKSEKLLESHFCFQVRYAGGMAIKMHPTTLAGIPDRQVLFNGKTWFVELKTPVGLVSPIQRSMHNRLKRNGFDVRIIRTKEEINAFIEEMKQSVK